MNFIEKVQNKVPCLMSRRFSFLAMTLLLGAFFIVEVVVGYITNSMALIADSFHMLSDVASLIVGYLALKYSTQETNREQYTYGYARAEVLGALVNAVFLVALCFSIFIAALKRLVILEEIENPLLVFCVGAAGLVVNIFGMFLFHQSGHEHSHGDLRHTHNSHGERSHRHSHHAESSHGHSHSGAKHRHSHGENKHEHSHSHLPSTNDNSNVAENDNLNNENINIQDKNEKTRKVIIEREFQGDDSHDHTETQDESEPKEQYFSESVTLKHTDDSQDDASIKHTDTTEEQLKLSVDDPTDESQDKHSHYSHDSSANLDELENRKYPKTKSAGHLNIQGVYLHILGDALGSVIVMISALIILYAHGRWTLYVDPMMSIIMVAIILKTSIPLLMETSKILMNSVPHHIQVTDLRQRLMKELPQIKNVHELHVWQLAGDKIIASAHVKFESPEDYDQISAKIKEFFHNEGIHSTTVQIEFETSNDEHRRGPCMVVCSLDSTCDDMMCCKPDKGMTPRTE